MKYWMLACLSVVLFSCDFTAKKANNTSSDKEESTVAYQLKIEDLQDKVFQTGATIHFTDSCAFDYGCDCCAGDLIFNADNTFYMDSYCESDQGVLMGTYAVEGNTLILKTTAKEASLKYNPEYEADESVEEYIMHVERVKPMELKYTASLCGEKLKLESTDVDEMAIETQADYLTAIGMLREQGFFDALGIKENL